jgi:hypothetical protein
MAFKLLDMTQQRWRRLDGAHLLPLVRAGTRTPAPKRRLAGALPAIRAAPVEVVVNPNIFIDRFLRPHCVPAAVSWNVAAPTLTK